jgi:3',5'-cyclic AMP phosphodiesterase CpdA
MKFIHITDTHRVAPPGRLYGLDPKARPDAAVADIKGHHDDAELVLVKGDLTHWGEPEAYRYFIVAMRPLPMPWVLVTPDAATAQFHDYLDQSARFPFGKYGVDDRVYALGPVGS